jgi:para-nitrobenzyl esterase
MTNHMRVFTFLTVLILSVNLYGISQNITAGNIVKVEGGFVEGILEDDVIAYKGIPFAAPPLGDLRWRPPQPVKSWDGILKADKYGPACPQANIAMLGYLDYGMSEDCLYLNIWKPASSSGEKLPVIVWIHGGGFAIGSTSQLVTTGEQLAKKGVIIVSIAYRLGALGFLSHPELTAESQYHVSGNYGLLDQIAALKWIQHNIEVFGGDPNCVTIFGLSAGGQSVSMLAASPLGTGLFQRAICMSGGSFGPSRMNKETDCMQLLKGAEQAGIEFVKRMSANSIDELRKMDPQKFLSDPSATIGGFWPVVDSYIISDDQYKLYQEGKYNDVPVLVGYTSDDGNLFVLGAKTTDYVESTKQRFGPVADKILGLYPPGTETETRRSMADLLRDCYFGWYTYVWSALQTKTGKSPVFVYYFDQTQPSSAITLLLKSDKAYHGSDCAYIFDHLDQDPKIKYTDEDKRLSEIMINYWINFARYGDPNGKDLPEWPVYNVENPTVMYLKGNPHTASLPDLVKLKVIDEYYLWKRASEEESK